MRQFHRDFSFYLKELSSSKPSPGGGSAAALSLSLGVGLVEMALRVSARGWTASRRQKAGFMLAELKKIRQKALRLVDKDAVVFRKFSLAKIASQKQKLLKKALLVSLETGGLAVEAVKTAEKSLPWVKKTILNDWNIGMGFMAVSLKASVLNAEGNLNYLKENSAEYIRLLNVLKKTLKGIKKYLS